MSLQTVMRWLNRVHRRSVRIRCRYRYVRSPKPLAASAKTYVTLFVDDHGRWSRNDPQAEISRRGVVWILDVLARGSIRATFNVVGKHAVEDAVILRRIIAEGHEIACHTMEHKSVLRCSAQAIEHDMMRFREAMVVYLPRGVTGFRAPRSEWNFAVLRGLLNAGILWNAESDKNPFPYVIMSRGQKRLWRLPVSIDDWEYETHAVTPREMAVSWTRVVEHAMERHYYAAIGVHPWVIAKDQSRMRMFSEFVQYLGGAESVICAPFADVAALCESASHPTAIENGRSLHLDAF